MGKTAALCLASVYPLAARNESGSFLCFCVIDDLYVSEIYHEDRVCTKTMCVFVSRVKKIYFWGIRFIFLVFLLLYKVYWLCAALAGEQSGNKRRAVMPF